MTDKRQSAQKNASPTTLKVIMAVLTLALVLTLANTTIFKYEKHLANGKPVLLELAPVDPRGFMKGDYMTLNFAIANDIRTALKSRYANDTRYWMMNHEGVVKVRLDEHGVAQFVRIIMSDDMDKAVNSGPEQTEKTNEIGLVFKVRQGNIKFATNAFFFQEGHAKDYEEAAYGVFAVNKAGNPLLKQLADKQYRIIQPDESQI